MRGASGERGWSIVRTSVHLIEIFKNEDIGCTREINFFA
jgi:hypothetical protein